jgi:hypothetical protein
VLNRRATARSEVVQAASTDSTIFARAYLESVTVEEFFNYEQQISRNPFIQSQGLPRGRIAISMPYDGYEYFTRDAVDDVTPHLRRRAAGGSLEALVGHLVLVDHQDTNLSDVLALDGRFGAFPLRVPVRTPVLDSADALVADRHEHRMEVDYAPSEGLPKVLPIMLSVELADPDHSDLPSVADVLRFTDDERGRLEPVAENIKRFIGFKPFLQVMITVKITLAARVNTDERPPVVRRIGVRVPTATSLAKSSMELEPMANVQHNPDNWNLEWFDVPMQRIGSTDEKQLRRFTSKSMVLMFKQPGELFAHSKLVIEANVEIPGELLSGTQIRIFDARGQRYPRARDSLTIRSILTSRCTVVLRDAFARRFVSPYQSFHFDEIIPDPLRVADIHAALSDQRFTISNHWDLDRADKRQLRHFLIAERTDGPDTMTLWVFVEGRGHLTRRQAQQPGGHQYTSTFDSGDLRIFVRGQVRRDTSNLVHEINAFQLALREHFRRLKAHR